MRPCRAPRVRRAPPPCPRPRMRALLLLESCGRPLASFLRAPRPPGTTSSLPSSTRATSLLFQHRRAFRSTPAQAYPASTAGGSPVRSAAPPLAEPPPSPRPSSYQFVPAYSLFAKRPPRPFPPPYHSPPRGSFSDPLTSEGAAFLRGVTNGDDAVLLGRWHLAVADGVGAWNTRSHGHAALWSRLLLHFFDGDITGVRPEGLEGEAAAASVPTPQPGKREGEAEEGKEKKGEGERVIGALERAYEATTAATGKWQGTTTFVSATLVGRTLYFANVGDSVALLVRPRERRVVLRTAEQWHWFDCPRQLGTNSPDAPAKDTVISSVDVQDGDIIIVASDGLLDNVWEWEVLEAVLDEASAAEDDGDDDNGGDGGEVAEVAEPTEDGDGEEKKEKKKAKRGSPERIAERLVRAAKNVAQNPFAESPYMERNIDEGLVFEGGKWDDISVVAAIIRKDPPDEYDWRNY